MSEENKQLYVCPDCHTFYISKPTSLKKFCQECKSPLKEVGFDYQKYSAFTDEQKKAFKNEYVRAHFYKDSPSYDQFIPMPQSRWAGFVGFCGWFVVLTLVFAGIFIFLTGNPIGGLAFIIAGPVSGGAVVLFSIVAKDVRHIRNQVDKLHYDRDHQ